MARLASPRGAASADVGKGMLLGAIGLAMLGAFVGGYWWVSKNHVALDKQTLCPVKGPRGIHAILIDRSDPISPQQGQRITFLVDELKKNAAFGQRFDVYTFEGDARNVSEPVLQVCSPGRPEDANALIENPERVRKQYDEKFSDELNKTIKALLQVSTKPNSPLIESIKGAALSSFGRSGEMNVPLRMTLISDMVQNSSLVSQFSAEPNFSQLARNPNWPTARPNLTGVSVDILYLLRPEAKRGGVSIQTRAHQYFWEQLVAASGGSVTRIEPI